MHFSVRQCFHRLQRFLRSIKTFFSPSNNNNLNVLRPASWSHHILRSHIISSSTSIAASLGAVTILLLFLLFAFLLHALGALQRYEHHLIFSLRTAAISSSYSPHGRPSANDEALLNAFSNSSTIASKSNPPTNASAGSAPVRNNNTHNHGHVFGQYDSEVAIVTLADPRFQLCALQLVTKVRQAGWHGPLFVLATNAPMFEATVVRNIEARGALLVDTHPVLDAWLGKSVHNRLIYRELQASKFRKLDIFFNPIFRGFRRVVYFDADGIIGSGTDSEKRKHFLRSTIAKDIDGGGDGVGGGSADAPLSLFNHVLRSAQMPVGKAVLLRQNDWSIGKHGLWRNELAVRWLNWWQRSILLHHYPDREMAGATSWMIVDMRRLDAHPPHIVFRDAVRILCTLRAAFKLNDQTLINLIFYDRIALIPWCSWNEIVPMQRGEELRRYCLSNMQMQRAVYGGLEFLYRHMSHKEKQRCVADGAELLSRGGAKAVWRRTVFRAEKPYDGGSHSCMRAFHNWKMRNGH